MRGLASKSEYPKVKTRAIHSSANISSSSYQPPNRYVGSSQNNIAVSYPGGGEMKTSLSNDFLFKGGVTTLPHNTPVKRIPADFARKNKAHLEGLSKPTDRSKKSNHNISVVGNVEVQRRRKNTRFGHETTPEDIQHVKQLFDSYETHNIMDMNEATFKALSQEIVDLRRHARPAPAISSGRPTPEPPIEARK